MTDQAEERRIERALEEVSEGLDQPMEVDPHPDRRRTFEQLGFARMRTRWTKGEEGVIESAKTQAELELDRYFADIYKIMNRLYEIVREPVRDPQTGETLTNRRGYVIWQKDEFGLEIEDWSRLTDGQKEEFLHQITTRMVMWEQRAADMWGEAMFAKGAWEERFALSFTDAPQVEGKRPTEADRTQHAQVVSREQRYLAIYMSVRSKKADALVRSMERLSQRLKDTSR
jgi:hypothetical protein